MGKVVYLDPIDHISGKIAKKHRTTYNYRNDSGAKYTSVYSTPNFAPTAAQIACKAKFRQAALQTQSIMQDIDQLEPYRAAWRNEIRNGNRRYATLHGYVFAQVYRSL